MSDRIWRDDEVSSEGMAPDPSDHALENIWRPHEIRSAESDKENRLHIDGDLWEREAEAQPGIPVAVKRKEQGLPRKSGPSIARTRQFTIALGLLVVVAFTGDVAYAGFGLRSSLMKAANEIEDGAESLRAGELSGASKSFEAAELASSEAKTLARRPGLSMLAKIPDLGRDVRTLLALAKSTELAARAGNNGVQAAQAMGAEGESLASAFFLQGRVQLENIAQGRPFVEEVVDLIAKSARVVARAPDPRIQAVREALDEARRRTVKADATAQKGSVLFSALPDLLGEDSSRQYLLAFQALGEGRATGGLIGLYGILNVQDGKVDLAKIEPIGSVFPGDLIEPPVNAPPSFERNYGSQYALRQVQQVNVSPNFPDVAEVFLRMYEQEAGDRLDGVIAMDSITLQQMMGGMDPIKSRFLDEPVGSDNAARVVMVDSYLEFDDSRVQNRFLADLIRRFWDELNGDINNLQTIEGLVDAVRTGHFKFYSSELSDQQALTELGADGGLPDDPNLHMVFHNNYSGNKVDYYLRRKVVTRLQLTSDGKARMRTRVVMRNTAPAGPASPLLGPPRDLAAEGDDPGLNRMILNFLLPEGAVPRSLRSDKREIEPFSYEESRHVVAWDVVEIPAGETAKVTLRSEGPANISRSGIFTVTLQSQTMVEPDRYVLKIKSPPGFLLQRANRLIAQPTATFEGSGVLDEPKTVRLELVPR